MARHRGLLTVTLLCVSLAAGCLGGAEPEPPRNTTGAELAPANTTLVNATGPGDATEPLEELPATTSLTLELDTRVPLGLTLPAGAKLRLDTLDPEKPLRFLLWGPDDTFLLRGANATGRWSGSVPGNTSGEHVLYIVSPANWDVLARVSGAGVHVASRELDLVRQEGEEVPIEGEGATSWTVAVPQRPLRVGLTITSGGPVHVLNRFTATVDSPSGRVLEESEDAPGSGGFGTGGAVLAAYTADPLNEHIVPGAYTFTVDADQPVGIAASSFVELYSRAADTVARLGRVSDSRGDAQFGAQGDLLAAAGMARTDQYDIRYVDVRPNGPEEVLLTLGLQNVSSLSVPAGYEAAYFAAAIELGGSPFMGVYTKEQSGGQSFFCAPDTLVLASPMSDPAEQVWSPIEGTFATEPSPVREPQRVPGSITFHLPPSCFSAEPGAELASQLAGGATVLVRSPSEGPDPLERVDHATGEITAELLAPLPEPAPEPEESGVEYLPLPGINASAEEVLTPSGTVETPSTDGVPVIWLAMGGALLIGGVVSGAAFVLLRPREGEAHARAPAEGVLFLGKYRIERALAKGAFGMVWLASHEALDRQVVLKQLHPSLASDQEAVKRLEREAKILARLDHPHITRIHDLERVDGTYYLVMEYVAGGSLKDLLDRSGRLPIQEAARLVDQVLAGLAYVHELGVLHRDLKPENILVTEGGDVKVADFGVARSAGLHQTAVTSLTGPASPPGTPLYMAPELFRGESGTPESDLYAVAATLYRMLTGESYLRSRPADLFSLRHAVLHEPPALPIPGAPEALDTWLATGLAKDPGARFGSAESMRVALAIAVGRGLTSRSS